MTEYFLRCSDCGMEGQMTRHTGICPVCHINDSHVYTCSHKGCDCGVSMCLPCLNALGYGHTWRIVATLATEASR